MSPYFCNFLAGSDRYEGCRKINYESLPCQHTKCQFHQCCTSSFCACRSRKRKNTVKSSVYFYAFGIYKRKTVCRMLMKLSPGVNFINILHEAFTFIGQKAQKDTKDMTVFFYSFWIFALKNCSWNVDEIDPRGRRRTS